VRSAAVCVKTCGRQYRALSEKAAEKVAHDGDETWRQVSATSATSGKGVFRPKSKGTQGDADPNLIKTSNRFEEGNLTLDLPGAYGPEGRELALSKRKTPTVINPRRMMPTLTSLRPPRGLRRESYRLYLVPMGSGRSRTCVRPAVCRPLRNTHKVTPTLFSLSPLGLLSRERSRLI
jgi:hypothetical protein